LWFPNLGLEALWLTRMVALSKSRTAAPPLPEPTLPEPRPPLVLLPLLELVGLPLVGSTVAHNPRSGMASLVHMQDKPVDIELLSLDGGDPVTPAT
jgi:hypothetical protein